MSEWIDFHALGQILLVGLICGAGLPALFAGGLKALSFATPSKVQSDGRTASVGVNPLGVAIAAVCFAVVLAAIGWGIYLIVAGT